MGEQNAKVPFVSCIKVRGIHLLPPVITPKRRVELQRYKQQAIKLEKRLKNCNDLKKNLEDLLNMQPLTNRPQSEISFQGNSHIEALGITDKTNDNSVSSTKYRKIKLSKDIIDVTQYDNNGIKIIYNETDGSDVQSSNTINVKNITNKELISEVNYQRQNAHHEENKIHKINNSPENDNRTSPVLDKSPKPRLIRSNSYTLDTPSPILLAHLEKNNKSIEAKNIDDIKHLSLSRNWSSLENNYIPFENSEFSSINTVYNNDLSDSANQDKTPTNIHTDPLPQEENVDLYTSPAIKVIQTDISVQNITVNANNDLLNEVIDENYDASDSQLLQVLRTLPDVYAKQIIEIIESQKLSKQESVKVIDEPEKRSQNDIKNLITKKDECSSLANEKNEVGNTPLENVNLERIVSFTGGDKRTGSTISLSPSQSIYYSITSSDTVPPFSNSSMRLVDFESEDADEKFDSPKKTEIIEYYSRKNLKNLGNTSRELFPQLNADTIYSMKQEWAASIIGAHVKGFLTRRLLKTERVQSLIETIKDALVCALELHNAENIDESDVELHRRLINQVSAACYTFHDIFFSLSVQEQMSIIATDRQRKFEKAKRPASAPISVGSKSSSTKSTPRTRMASHSQSVTKV